MGMLDRFTGEGSHRLLLEALAAQKLVGGNKQLAEELAGAVQVMGFSPGDVLIEQGGSDNDIYLILSGKVDIIINGRTLHQRGTDDSVGEMAAIEPTQKRSATVQAAEETVAAKLSEKQFAEISSRHSDMYRAIARVLAKRLLQRNSYVKSTRDKIRVFVISSAEALEVARVVQNHFSHDDFSVTVWTDGVFKATNYTLDSLERAVDDSDFAIAIAHADDITEFRGKEWPSPRDNVIFELGLFMGRLGRHRAILMEPREAKVKLPSDLAGVTTIPYRYQPGKDAQASMGPACNELREHIKAYGPNN